MKSAMYDEAAILVLAGSMTILYLVLMAEIMVK